MRALVIGAAPVAGSGELLRRLASDCDLVVGADAGAEWSMSQGVTPDIAVGDFDSASPGALTRLAASDVRVVRYPAEKDRSDLDLAVAVARQEGASELVLSACTSARLDHTLAALGTALANADIPLSMREPGMSVWVLSASRRTTTELQIAEGSTVSVMAPCGASGVSLTGFRYPLAEADLTPMSSWGLSNVTTSETVTVTVFSGTVLVMASS